MDSGHCRVNRRARGLARSCNADPLCSLAHCANGAVESVRDVVETGRLLWAVEPGQPVGAARADRGADGRILGPVHRRRCARQDKGPGLGLTQGPALPRAAHDDRPLPSRQRSRYASMSARS